MRNIVQVEGDRQLCPGCRVEVKSQVKFGVIAGKHGAWSITITHPLPLCPLYEALAEVPG